MPTLQLGDDAPDFTASTTEGEIAFHQWLGDGWGILFSHPSDFTPVCTTELGRVAALKSEWDKRNTKVLAISVDSLSSHEQWADDIGETQGHALNYPLIADPDRSIADAYGMLHPNAADTTTVRSVFVIGPDKKIKLTMTYPPAVGRNFDEIVRALDALQLNAKHKVATPVDWKPGADVIIPVAISDEQAKEMFPGGFVSHKPYLRTTAQPS